MAEGMAAQRRNDGARCFGRNELLGKMLRSDASIRKT
jgi:hypothetical protein